MRRKEVWLINLDPTIGAEIRKTRPAVIVNDDANGLEKVSAADAFQVRSVARERFVRRVGALTEGVMHKISQAPVVVLKIEASSGRQS
jgi:mRNA interferase MazF